MWFSLLFVLAIAGALAYAWLSDKSRSIAEDEFNKNLYLKLEADRKAFEEDLQRKAMFYEKIRQELLPGFMHGRKWLANYIAEADKAYDDSLTTYFMDKPHPAYSTAFAIRAVKAEKREWKEKAKYLEYQIQSYKEYFPFLEEYEDAILDESINLTSDADNVENLKTDPAVKYLSKEEYEKLPTAQRHQLALNKFICSNLSPSSIGKLYEQYIGYLYEKQGYDVEYHGIVNGLEDLGRDLICTKGTEVIIIQAKCWSANKTIHEKHIFQLYGSTLLYRLNGKIKRECGAQAYFYTTTKLSNVAKDVANSLNVVVHELFALDKSFPLIKCNINQATKEKIYHLPFDQQYDKVIITPSQGECYTLTVQEAEDKGFRRAKRYFRTPD